MKKEGKGREEGNYSSEAGKEGENDLKDMVTHLWEGEAWKEGNKDTNELKAEMLCNIFSEKGQQSHLQIEGHLLLVFTSSGSNNNRV